MLLRRSILPALLAALAVLPACGPRRQKPTPPTESTQARQAFDAAVAAFEAGDLPTARDRFSALLRGPVDPAVRPFATYYLARIESLRRPGSGSEALLAMADASLSDDLRWAAALHGSLAAARAGRCGRVRPETPMLAEQLEGTERADAELALSGCAKGAVAFAHLRAAAEADPARETEARARAERLLGDAAPTRAMVDAWPAYFAGTKVAVDPEDRPPDTGPAPSKTGRTHVGVLVPLSGNLRPLGERLAAGLEASFSNEDRPGAPGPVLLVRDGARAEELADAFDAFVEEGAFAVVGLFDKAVAPAAAQAAAERELPLVMLTSSDVATAVEGPVWRALQTPSLVARTAAGAGLMKGGRRAAVLRPGNSYGKTLGAWFSESWKAGGGELVGELVWAPRKPRWARIAKQARRLGADTLFVPCDARSGAQLLSHLAAEGTWVRGASARFKKKSGAQEVWVIGTPEWYAPSLLQQARRYAEGLMVPVPFATETARGAAFAEDLRRKTENAATAFDALLADVVSALQQAHGAALADGLSAEDAIARTRFSEGHTAGLDFSERDAVQALFLMVVEGGRFTPMQ